MKWFSSELVAACFEKIGLMNRREVLRITPAALLGGGLAGCSTQQVTDFQKIVANIINQVQSGVVTGCAQLGKLVPTANSVIAVVEGIAKAAGVTSFTDPA